MLPSCQRFKVLKKSNLDIANKLCAKHMHPRYKRNKANRSLYPKFSIFKDLTFTQKATFLSTSIFKDGVFLYETAMNKD